MGGSVRRFQITHPFHPLCGTEYEVVTRRYGWGKDRVFYYAADDGLKSVVANMTDVIARDAFDRISAGRSAFRVDDLLELQRLLEKHKKRELGEIDA